MKLIRVPPTRLGGYQPIPRDKSLVPIEPRKERSNKIRTERDRIVDWIAHVHGVRVADIYGPTRARRVAEARQEAFYQIRLRLGWQLTKIGRIFNRDHSTVLHGILTHAAKNGLPVPGYRVFERKEISKDDLWKMVEDLSDEIIRLRRSAMVESDGRKSK